MGKRIAIATLGSLGDIHPYLAVAIGLQKRGHEVVIATSEMYRAMIEGAGVDFHPVRPDLATSFYNDPKAMRRALDRNAGIRYFLCQIIVRRLKETYEDLLQACRGKQLLVGHTLTFALPLVAEKLRLPWVSIALQPLILFSNYDPPPVSGATRPYRPKRLSRWKFELLMDLTKRRTRSWMKPVDELRKRLGLAPAAGHPLFEGKFSPYGTLAWFSRLVGPPRPDWPALTRITGFPFYNPQAPGGGLDPRLAEFLEKGEPPIVFTLGSIGLLDLGTLDADEFFAQSILAARRLGCRAVLLTGAQTASRVRTQLPATMTVCNYAPYSAVFPQAAAVVHHGGIGTTAHALHAGHPMLVVPFVNDQLDNGERARKLGVARVVDKRWYTAKRAQAELTQLLSESSYASRAANIGQAIRKEDGVGAACDALEALATGV